MRQLRFQIKLQNPLLCTLSHINQLSCWCHGDSAPPPAAAAGLPALLSRPCGYRRRQAAAPRPPSRRRRAAAGVAAEMPPARDRVIDFGKYRGRMLGTLPSSYLNWVSRNLRAGDSLQWALLADEVLSDEVYRDRLEWESAERLLTGGATGAAAAATVSPVAELLDVSRRFGWDNDDKEGWRMVDFELLGTSRGGRIPRLAARPAGGAAAAAPTGGKRAGSGAAEDCWIHRGGRTAAPPPGGRRVARLSEGCRFTVGGEAEAAATGAEEKREERRQRLRMKREQRMLALRRDLGLDGGGAAGGGGGGEEAAVAREGKGGAAILPNSSLRGLLNKIRGREP
ncbi:unnamed protein product [Spirodela intermedia]|uniref:Uncharacterized protein n=1 Tax=Spirodela intermedia TaxID=51605 RepID=A0A7I8ID64_SPIIN|nr:unnamed protein product [Spirodela intermedia]CAA6655334.1 unnamed protein product [Spirodela intermedia]